MKTSHHKIVLATLNARYSHAALGLRYLMANMGDLTEETTLLEFDTHTPLETIATQLTLQQPAILGLGVYIWNTTRLAALLPMLKTFLPDSVIVLGGPEVSYDPDPVLVHHADYILGGEADTAFADLCRQVLTGRPPAQKHLVATPPDLLTLRPPYDLYSDHDIAHRTVYVEASRGCPLRCEYCLSSLDTSVRHFPLPELLIQFERLLERGVRHFKFTDRSLNLNPERCEELLAFFAARYQPGLFLHFEMLPDRFPDTLKSVLQVFPAGALQLEIGVQTLNPDVARRIRRAQDMERTLEHLRFLREHTGVYIHADLIAGLPGESPESFAAGFDRLAACRPHEIQFGILKKLRGTALARHDEEWKMRYNPHPPYNLLSNRLIDRALMERFERFAHYWDKVLNSGRFLHTTPLMGGDSASCFNAFLTFSDWVFAQQGRTHSIALNEWAALLHRYLTGRNPSASDSVLEALRADYAHRPLRDQPAFLRREGDESAPPRPVDKKSGAPLRQARHYRHPA